MGAPLRLTAFVLLEGRTIGRRRGGTECSVLLSVESGLDAPCIPFDAAEGGARGFGFEGGRVLREGGDYHLFTTELLSPPIWVATAFAHWISADGLRWRRQGTILRSTGDHTGEDPRAALFSPMPVFDAARDRWQLFYVAYRSAPDTPTEFRRNHAGRVLRAESQTPGRSGIGGPYTDVAVVLEPGEASQPWEGLQGTDSFFPFPAGEHSWLAFYGSASTELYGVRRPSGTPATRWAVGLAEAPALSGPWTRRPTGNPCEFEPAFIENPVVTRMPDGLLVAVYENESATPEQQRSFGLASSRDGLEWTRERPVSLPGGVAPWVTRVRTPLGVIPDGDGVRVYFTGFSAENPDPLAGARSAVGMVRARVH